MEELSKLSRFLKISDVRLEQFIRKIKFHKDRSIVLYDGHQWSYTLGDTDKLIYHSKFLTEDEKQGFDAFYRERFPELYLKYLKRYEEKAELAHVLESLV